MKTKPNPQPFCRECLAKRCNGYQIPDKFLQWQRQCHDCGEVKPCAMDDPASLPPKPKHPAAPKPEEKP